MNPNSTGALASAGAPLSNVDQAINEIDSLTDDLNNVAGLFERDLHPVLLAPKPHPVEGTPNADPAAETELLTKLKVQANRLHGLLRRYRELHGRVSI